MANPLAQREWQMRRCQVGVDCQFIFVVSLSSCPSLYCGVLVLSCLSSLATLVLFCGVLVLLPVVSLSSTAVNADDQARRSCRLYTSCIFIVSVLKKCVFLSLGRAVEGLQETQELSRSETKGADSRTQSWQCP